MSSEAGEHSRAASSTPRRYAWSLLLLADLNEHSGIGNLLLYEVSRTNIHHDRFNVRQRSGNVHG
jgi:hypothetical protein